MNRQSWPWAIIAIWLIGCSTDNRAPALNFVENAAVVVGEELVIALSAHDPDGDAISFKAVGAPADATLEQFNTTAVFRWAPLITDTAPGGKIIEVIFQVTDSNGATTSQTIEITVYAEGGVPEFITPSGFVINMAVENHVAFLVEVKDDDNVTVVLTAESDIEGASFQQVSGKIASFYWSPSPTQLNTSNYWSFLVTAEDGVHPPVVEEISVVLINADTDTCPGSNPFGQHTPLPDQFVGGPYDISLYASDGETEVTDVQLHWRRLSDTSSPFQKTYLQHQGGELWSGTISPPALFGSETDIYSYYFTFRDNDDITGSNCDHSVRLPKSGEYAFVAYGPAGGGCLDDAFEPNDSALSATPIGEGTYSTMRSCGGSDWYSILVKEGYSLTADLRFEPSHGNLALSLHSETGFSLMSGTGEGPESLFYGPVIEDTEILVQVDSVDTFPMTYGLDLHQSLGGCNNDPLEPNNDVVTATQLPPGVYENLIVCPGDQDWYAFPLSAGQQFEVEITFQQTDGDIDAVIYAPDGISIIEYAFSSTSNESLQMEAPVTGTYYVVVDGFLGASNTYDLSVLVNNQTELCFEDILAPNHSPEKAVVLPAGSWPSFTMCPGTSDYFAYTVNGSETIDVTVTSDEGLPPTVRILGPDTSVVVGGNGVQDNASWAQADAFVTGTYTFEVSPTSDSAVEYNIAFGATDPEEGNCLNDRFEPNDSFQSPQPIEDGVTTRIKICPGDVDWFEVFLGAYQVVEVWALFRHEFGDVDLAIYNTAGSLLGEAISTTDDEIMTFLTSEAGLYYIQLRSKGAINNAVDLVISSED